jgi:hypothetical protein
VEDINASLYVTLEYVFLALMSTCLYNPYYVPDFSL